MIIKNELINKIKDNFNLNIYETKVWIALLGKGVASAGEIAEVSGVPRSRTYDVLEGLEKRGFTIMKLGKPVKYIAIKPKIIIEKLKTKTMKESEEKIENITNIKDTNEYRELEHLYDTGINPIKQEDISGSVRGRSAIYNHIKELLENSKHEAIICTSALEMQIKSKFFSLIFNRLRKTGIKIKVALSGNEKDIRKIANKFKIKINKINIDSKFFISDNEEMLFIISNGKLPDEEIAIWLNTPFFASSLSFMFDQAVKE